MKNMSLSQFVVIAAPAIIILILLSYKFGEYNSKQRYINYGAAQHWQGKIECGRVGEEIFCAKTGIE